MDKEQGPTPDDYRDARGPEWRAIFDTLRDYRLSNMTYEGTSDEFYPLVDLMSNEGQGIDTGEMQMVELADEISLAVKTARRSSDEQAEVVGHQWRYRTDPPDAQWRTPSPADLEYVRSLPDKYEVRALFASPPAVAKGGVTEEMVEAAARTLASRAVGRVSTGDKAKASQMVDRGWIIYEDDARAALTASQALGDT